MYDCGKCKCLVNIILWSCTLPTWNFKIQEKHMALTIINTDFLTWIQSEKRVLQHFCFIFSQLTWAAHMSCASCELCYNLETLFHMTSIAINIDKQFSSGKVTLFKRNSIVFLDNIRLGIENWYLFHAFKLFFS